MRIYILGFLIFSQSFLACQQESGKTLTSEASLFLHSAAPCQEPEKARTSATNIIFQSTDGGQTWQDVSAGLPVGFSPGRVIAGNGEVFLCSEKEMYFSNTSSAIPEWGNEVVCTDMGISDIFPGQAGQYISSYNKGLFQNIPGTGVLMPLHNTLEDKTVRTVLAAPDGALFVGCESGIYKSADGGNSWKQVYAGVGVNSLAAGEGVLVSGTYDGLLRSTDGGEHWDWVLTEDGSAYRTGYMDGRFVTVTRGAKSWQDEVNAVGLTNRLRTSTDGGKTWQRMDESLSHPLLIFTMEGSQTPIREIYDVKQVGKDLFCSCDTGIFRSSDWGKNWEPVFPHTGKNLVHLAVSGYVIYAVLVVGC